MSECEKLQAMSEELAKARELEGKLNYILGFSLRDCSTPPVKIIDDLGHADLRHAHVLFDAAKAISGEEHTIEQLYDKAQEQVGVEMWEWLIKASEIMESIRDWYVRRPV